MTPSLKLKTHKSKKTTLQLPNDCFTSFTKNHNPPFTWSTLWNSRDYGCFLEFLVIKVLFHDMQVNNTHIQTNPTHTYWEDSRSLLRSLGFSSHPYQPSKPIPRLNFYLFKYTSGYPWRSDTIRPCLPFFFLHLDGLKTPIYTQTIIKWVARIDGGIQKKVKEPQPKPPLYPSAQTHPQKT